MGNYNCRWTLLASLGRFVSADTIIPDPTTPGDFNRYTYVRNNPLGYVDPGGHAQIASGVGGLTEKGWYEFYYNNPEVYYADYWQWPTSTACATSTNRCSRRAWRGSA